MKGFYTILFLNFTFSLLTFNSFSQIPNWEWAKNAGGSVDDWGRSISNDANGNVYAIGNFNSAAIAFGTHILTNTFGGNSDIFIVKYDASGNVVWATSAGGSNFDEGISISSDANGNVYATGYFRSATITFGNTTLTNVSGSGSYGDIFIVKYDASGNFQWAQRAGGSSDDRGFGIFANSSGNVLLTGRFTSTNITFGGYTLTGGGVFVVKYDASGNVLWATNATGGNGEGRSIYSDANQNVFVTGNFVTSSIAFGGTTLTNSGSGSSDVFVVKYDGLGNPLWAKSAGGGDGSDIGYGITTDSNDNVLVTGGFKSSAIVFGTTTLTNSSSGYDDVFILKYSSSGNQLWAIRAGSLFDDTGYGISADDNGNFYVIGNFQNSIGFGSSGSSLTSSILDLLEIFIVKFDASENPMWAKGVGSAHDDTGYGISIDFNGNIYSTGYFENNIAFGNINLNNSSSSPDVFVAKLSSPCSYSINSSSQNFSSTGGNSSFNLTTEANCTWQVSVDCNWVTVNSSLSGSGNTTVTYSVAANSGSNQRTCHITIGGQSYTITQDGDIPSCSGWMLSNSAIFDAEGESTIETITTTPSNCGWNSNNINCPWIVIAPTSGSGTTQVTITAFPNQTNLSREYIIDFGYGIEFTAWQLPAPLGMEEVETDFSIYPNPATTNLTIETTLKSNCTIQTEIRNILGQVVYTLNEKASSGIYKKTIDVNLFQGIYFLTLQTNEGRTTKKIEIVK